MCIHGLVNQIADHMMDLFMKYVVIYHGLSSSRGGTEGVLCFDVGDDG